MNKNSIINYMICMITTFKKVLCVKLSYMERMTSWKFCIGKIHPSL